MTWEEIKDGWTEFLNRERPSRTRSAARNLSVIRGRGTVTRPRGGSVRAGIAFERPASEFERRFVAASRSASIR